MAASSSDSRSFQLLGFPTVDQQELTCVNTEDPDDMLNAGARMLTWAVALGERKAEAWACGALICEALIALGRIDEAVSYGLKAVALSRQLGNVALMETMHDNVAEAYFKSGRYNSATYHFKKALLAAKKRDNFETIPAHYWDVARSLKFEEDFAQALIYFEAAFVNHLESGCRLGQVLTTVEIGLTLQASKRPDDSEAFFAFAREILHIDQPFISVPCDVEIYLRRGEALNFIRQGNHANAIDTLKKCIERCDDGRAPGDMFHVYAILGSVYSSLYQSSESARCSYRQLELAEELNDELLQIEAHTNLAQATNKHERTGSEIEIITSISLPHLDIAKRLADKYNVIIGRPWIHVIAAELLRFIRRYEDAHKEATEALHWLSKYKDLGKKEDLRLKARIQMALSQILRFKLRPEDALRWAERALESAEEIDDPLFKYLCHIAAAQSFYNVNNIVRTTQHLEKGLELLETIQLEGELDMRYSLFAAQEFVYRILELYHVARGNFDLAFGLAEQSRARVLNQSLGKKINGDTISPIPLAQNVAAKMEATLLYYSVIFVNPNIIAWVCALKPDGNFKYVLINVPAPDWILSDFEVASEADAVEGLASFLPNLLPDSAWQPAGKSLKAGQPEIAVFLDRVDRGAPWRTHRKVIVKFSQSPDAKVWSEEKLFFLYDVFIKPIEDMLPPGASDGDRVAPLVIILPNSFLCSVPFAALMRGNDEIFGSRFALSSITSVGLAATLLDKLPESSKTISFHDSCVAIGNPTPMPKDETGSHLMPLYWAESEATAVAGIFHCEPLIGQAAIKDEVVKLLQQPTTRVAHFATHATTEHPTAQNKFAFGLTGSIALVANEGNDGFLRAGEIRTLLCPSLETVVLSCCDTAAGEVTREGVLGLTYAFFCAGARSVMASLWPISDQKTSLFMQDFYSHYINDGMALTAALRLAMLKARKRNTDKKDLESWAMFVIYGLP